MPPIAWHLPVWPFWLAGALCEAVCAPFGSSRRSTAAAWISSRRAARSTSRARDAELGYAPAVGLTDGISRTLDVVPRREGWI